MFCMKCGAQLPDNAKFCYKCGCQTPQQGDAVPSPAAPVQPTAAPAQSAAAPVQPTAAATPVQPTTPTPPSPVVQVPSPARPAPVPPAQASAPPYAPVIKQRPKWLIPVVLGAVALFVIVAAVLASTLLGGGGAVPIEPDAPASSVTAPPATDFQRYENSATCFALDYPSDFTCSEPNTNNVLFALGDQCRVVAEYAYVTTKNCFIYSAEDFADQLFADPTLLASWVGAENVYLTDNSEEKVNGRDCYSFGWELEQNGKQYDGCLYLFDTDGDFGCYTFLWMVEKGMPGEDLRREQVRQMLESFEITGAYQAEGYTLYTSEAPDELEVILRDDLVRREPELGYEKEILKNYVKFYATETGQSTVSMYTDKYSTVSTNPDSDDFAKVVDTAVNTYRKDKDCRDFQIISELTRLDDVGRYPFVQLGMQFHYTGYGADQDHFCYKVFFPHGGSYWIAELRATEENAQQTSDLLSDFLMSLRIDDSGLEFGDDAFGSLSSVNVGSVSGSGTNKPSSSGGDKNQMVDEILSEVESRSDFLAPDSYYEPLVSLTDIDKNGVSELLVLYKTKDYQVKYCVWSFVRNSYSLLKEDILYAEVGGNSGSLGLALDENNIPYLVLEARNPQGDRFHNTYTYIPWNHEQTEFSDQETVVLESSGTYGEEEKGTYTLAGTRVDKKIFDDWRDDFTQNWTALDLNKGEGNGGNNMSFHRIRELDMNTMTF